MATTSDETKTEAVTSARSYYMGEGPYALNEDDSAVDPVAFREALMQDAEKLKSIEQDEELAKALLGEDTGTMQEALKKLLAMVRARTTGATGARSIRCVTRTRTDEETASRRARSAETKTNKIRTTTCNRTISCARDARCRETRRCCIKACSRRGCSTVPRSDF